MRAMFHLAYPGTRDIATDPTALSRNEVRRDIGSFPSVAVQAAEALRAHYVEHPGWTAQLPTSSGGGRAVIRTARSLRV
jgi:hypothetical protein